LEKKERADPLPDLNHGYVPDEKKTGSQRHRKFNHVVRRTMMHSDTAHRHHAGTRGRLVLFLASASLLAMVGATHASDYASAPDTTLAIMQQAVVPSVATTHYVLRDLAATINEPVSFDIRFTVDGRAPDAPLAVTFFCPDEFGAACDGLIEPVLALGGDCEHGLGTTACELPPVLPTPLPTPVPVP